jgi:beta-lactamase superfamily II metal-dependent hydrolase
MSGDSIRVRMYNVGFGDCFLLSWPGPERTLKVLIDCGSHGHGAGPHPIGEVVERIIEDVREDGAPRIDVVVGTHRHQDHVSGFDSALWGEVEVAEVWMPWTEHPTDPEARSIRETQSRAAKRLHAEVSALEVKEEPLRDSLLALSANSLTNAQAMETLHHGFKGRPKRRFLPRKTGKRRSIEAGCLPGALVHVLGPSRDPGVIRDMDPPAGRSYLRMTEERERDGDHCWLPFRSSWKIAPEEMASGEDTRHLVPERETDLRTIHNYGEMDSDARFELAVQLEKSVNGTSLVLVFEIGRACLLFPGDAQWGTWRVALEDPEWRNLLARTSFCKVGHHGSHNATPKDLLEGALGDGFAAMVSTRTISNWPDIPRPPLLEKLAEKTGNRVARSDRPGEIPTGFHGEGDLYCDVEIPL